MRNDDHRWFRQTLAGALFGMLVMTAFPAVAAQVGDALALGEVNRIDDRTDLKGSARGANLQIKNTGNSSALAAKADRQAIVAKATSGPVAVNAKADRVAIKIKVDDGQAPLKVNSSAGTATNLSADLLDGRDSTDFLGATETAVDAKMLDGQAASALDVDSVDGYDANWLVRVAFAQSEDLPDGGSVEFTGGVAGEADVLETVLTAPTPGWVILTASVDAFNTSALDVFDCEFRVDGARVIGSPQFAQLDGNGSTNGEEDCTTHGVEQVTEGEHSIALRLGGANPVETSTSFAHGTLSALFVPFDGSGAESLVLEADSGDEDGGPSR